MEAVILAGGVGRRLQQVVPDMPKPMALISGRPFLEFLLDKLAQRGFSRVVLSLGYMAEKISDHFGTHFASMEIAYVVESYPLGTGGAVRLAFEKCKQDYVFVFNGDTYLDIEVDEINQQWQRNKYPIVVAKEVPDTTRYGRLVVDGDIISNFCEKGITGPGIINAGCYLLARDALDKFPLNKTFSIETDYLEKEVERATVEVFVTRSKFIDIGIPEDYARAQNLIKDLQF